MERTGEKISFNFRKIYRRLFIKNAFKFFLSDSHFRIINFLSDIFFSRAKKRTKILMFANNLLNDKICERQKLYGKCEYLKKKLMVYQQ